MRVDRRGLRKRKRQKDVLRASLHLVTFVETNIRHKVFDEDARRPILDLREYLKTLQAGAKRLKFPDEELNALVAELDSRIARIESESGNWLH